MALRTEKLFDEAVTVKGWRRQMAEADMNGSSFEKTAQDVHDLSSLMTKESLEKQIAQLAVSIERHTWPRASQSLPIHWTIRRSRR